MKNGFKWPECDNKFSKFYNASTKPTGRYYKHTHTHTSYFSMEWVICGTGTTCKHIKNYERSFPFISSKLIDIHAVHLNSRVFFVLYGIEWLCPTACYEIEIQMNCSNVGIWMTVINSRKSQNAIKEYDAYEMKRHFNRIGQVSMIFGKCQMK